MDRIPNLKKKTGSKLRPYTKWKKRVSQTDKAALDIETRNNKARRARISARLLKAEYQEEREIQTGNSIA